MLQGHLRDPELFEGSLIASDHPERLGRMDVLQIPSIKQYHLLRLRLTISVMVLSLWNRPLLLPPPNTLYDSHPDAILKVIENLQILRYIICCFFDMLRMLSPNLHDTFSLFYHLFKV